MHALRVVMLVLLAIPLRLANHPAPALPPGQPLPLSQVRRGLPRADHLEGPAVEGGWWNVVDGQTASIGMATQTSPLSDRVIGYRGPSNVLLVADPTGEIVYAHLLSSRDTEEHVRSTVEDTEFFASLVGLRLGEPMPHVDAVSGATLTSFAILEAVSLRVSGGRPSLKFPQPLRWQEGKVWFPLAVSGAALGAEGSEMEMRDAEGNVLGVLARTGPRADAVIGYQGPSEALIAIDRRGAIIGAVLRESYDNQPYTRYVREEPYFWDHFRGMTPAELSQTTLEAMEVEGVSGATMTSQAVAQSIMTWADSYAAERGRKLEAASHWGPWGLRWEWKDTLTLAFVIGAIVMAGTRLRGMRKVRRVWLVMTIAGFGLLSGNLISQVLILGWAESGIAWRLAPALTIVLGVMLVAPPLSKRNIYCHHLCPHGAAQQLLRGRLSAPDVGAKRAAVLTKIPSVLLIAAYGVTLVGADAHLAHWEPFDAYLWPVAAVGSVVLAVVSLGLAAMVPMAYCRFGCPTGRLLDYLRRSARSDRWTNRDSVVLGLVALAWAWTWWMRV